MIHLPSGPSDMFTKVLMIPKLHTKGISSRNYLPRELSGRITTLETRSPPIPCRERFVI